VAVETLAADLGLARSRFFLDQPAPELELALTMLGYRSRMETGLLRAAAPRKSSVELTPIATDEDWSSMLAIHSGMDAGPDGFVIDPIHWTGFAKAKQTAGYFTLYLAQRDGVTCGAVGFRGTRHLLRLKNLVVAPTHRRRGVGAAILDAAAAMAHARGLAAVGCFALPGEAGDALYRSNGFVPATSQMGWDRALTAQIPARLAARKRMHAYS
jgi:GNAT superfamily N-acetyltransferase